MIKKYLFVIIFFVEVGVGGRRGEIGMWEGERDGNVEQEGGGR